MGKDIKAKPSVDQELIRELAQLLTETGLTEIEIDRDGMRVRVARQLGPALAAAPAIAGPPSIAAPAQPEPDTGEPDPAQHPGCVRSPMVGVAYLAPEPGAAPFVSAGARVAQGQTLLIIEAMKTMNHIPAPKAGVVTRILVGNSQPVEFGEPLVIIE
ncbi:MAG TPA: acetyl-CoA carboxylase biotin carboxyl carrier protein [Hyphomicrobiaceae bacterium]|jgi:acetyl-CoA carboxylase biotin carboxyl carrier protein|nr:acetyl-CoA carboxylase biotin carboxyl carrier protein [Hyphomicrobiaceae bacterium]